MTLNSSAPWHRASFDKFIQERLPQLLSERLPLTGYHAESTGVHTCSLRIVIGSETGDVDLAYADLPQPDADGVFLIDGNYRVVVPVPSQLELDAAEIHCVGEQLYDFFKARLGEAPDNVTWDAPLAKMWLPLDAWMREFHAGPTSQYLQTTNWLDRHTHLRRLTLVPILPRVLGVDEVFTPGQVGRTCPFCTPEGPNIARLLEIAQGAEICDGKLVITDDRAEAALGLSASAVPFLEHTDSNRLLMGVNMMRQWIPPSAPEPALVQTGAEPDAPKFWCGHNLLTAFIPWDGDAFEDAIVISASCAKRLQYPAPVEPGDKFSNRYGAKGVISRILPDDEMPCLPDGTPVELIYSLCGLPSRLNFGQVREAVMGRIAKTEGKPATVPPFHAPDERELRERLRKAGLPEDGMEVLTLKGKKFSYRSTVGWVYWGCTLHVARDKIRASAGEKGSQLLKEIECAVLREAKAVEVIRELFNTLAEDRDDAATLVARVASGPVSQAPPPTPAFADLTRRLSIAGIRADLQGEKLSFGFSQPDGPVLKLARPMPHPWLPQRQLVEIASQEEMPEYGALVEANTRLERMLRSQTPEPLIGKAVAQLETRVRAFFDALFSPEHVQFRSRLLFSGRTVIAPGPDLRIDQVGLAEEIAWTLFGPRLVRELRNKEDVRKRSRRATQALDDLLARSWVILFRAPAFSPTAFVAFHPVRRPDRTLRLHPLACEMLNADFDGDQAAVLLPVTDAAQQEAGERLSVAGHLARDPDLIRSLAPRMDAVFGLANLSLSPGGLQEIQKLAGTEVATEGGIVTRRALIDALQNVLTRDGASAALDISERLMRRGFEVAKTLGASLNPFLGASLNQPPAPETDDPDQWKAYSEELFGWAGSCGEFSDNDFGTIRLLAQSGARGSLLQLVQYLKAPGIVLDVRGNVVPIRHGWREGLTPEEVFARVNGARKGLAQVVAEMEEMGRGLRMKIAPTGYGVLARARRSERPGVVFARAAAKQETDPLTDADSRLFVGLPVEGLG